MTDPTITIAGLEARINSLRSAVQHSNRTAAERMTMFVEASSNADRLTAERDALAAQLAEVRAELAAAPKVCAIHGMPLDAEAGAFHDLRTELEATRSEWNAARQSLASERAHLAACRTRIAGLEQAADERSAEVARLTARVAELEARPVLTHEILSAAIKKARKVPPYIARQAADEYMPHLGPVMLPAQDAAAELAAQIQNKAHALNPRIYGWTWDNLDAEQRSVSVEATRRALASLASLGAPPTSPTQDGPMRHHESRDYALQSPANGYWPADVGAINGTEAMVMGAMLRSVGPHPISDAALIAMARTAIECVDKLGAPPTSPPVTIDADALYARCERDFMGGYSGPLYDAFKHGMWTVCNVLRSTPPTSPPAARPVFAGVSMDDLVSAYMDDKCRDHKKGGAEMCCIDSGLRAVLARLEVSLVAPVDPEAFARDFYGQKILSSPTWDEFVVAGRSSRIAAMRATLTARGIPVTPERGK